MLFLKNLKVALVFVIPFLLMLIISFTVKVADGTQTLNILILASIIVSCLITAEFILIKWLLKFVAVADTILAESLLLFVLAILTLWIVSGQISFFYWIYKPAEYLTTNPDVLKFQNERNFAFSLSVLIADAVFVLTRIMYRTSQKHF